MQLPDINLESITDPAARQLLGHLLNSIEAIHTELLSLRTENQHLRDENARLKGGSGTPDLKANTPPPVTDHSSEAERHTRTPRGKPKKNALLVVTREHPCVLDPASLPAEAVRHATSMELAARRRVRKRDVSFGPQSVAGARAWDSFQTLIATATKLGVRLYDYLLQRRVAPNETPSLADHIRLRTLASNAAPA
jgi:hypothetical protein